MRALELLQIQWVLLMLGVGGVIVALIYLGFMRHGREHDGPVETEEFPEGLRETSYGVPPVLKLAYAVIALSALGHVLYVWLSGVTY